MRGKLRELRILFEIAVQITQRRDNPLECGSLFAESLRFVLVLPYGRVRKFAFDLL